MLGWKAPPDALEAVWQSPGRSGGAFLGFQLFGEGVGHFFGLVLLGKNIAGAMVCVIDDPFPAVRGDGDAVNSSFEITGLLDFCSFW